MALVRERYPRLEIEVTSDTTIHLANLLRGGEIELILQTDAIAGPDFTNLPLCEFPVRWVASPKLGLSGRTLDLVDLADFPIVSFSRHSGPHATLEQLFALAVERPARINCITSVAAMIRLVADGFGVAALPPAIIQRELREGTLEVLDVSAEFPALPLMATCRAHSHPLAARIADLARQAASEFEAALHAEPAPAAKAEAKPGTSSKRGARKTGGAQTLSPAVNAGKPGRTRKSAQSKSPENKRAESKS
jgi:DNA-binding transcriptional LysR family regulator